MRVVIGTLRATDAGKERRKDSMVRKKLPIGNEVAELLNYYGLDDLHDTVRDWYDGYQFGNTSVYCPWDVIKYA